MNKARRIGLPEVDEPESLGSALTAFVFTILTIVVIGMICLILQ